jgi:hypothetical protein
MSAADKARLLVFPSAFPFCPRSILPFVPGCQQVPAHDAIMTRLARSVARSTRVAFRIPEMLLPFPILKHMQFGIAVVG